MKFQVSLLLKPVSFMALLSLFVVCNITNAAVVHLKPERPLSYKNYGQPSVTIIESIDLTLDGSPDFVINSNGAGAGLNTAAGWEIYGVSASLLGFSYPDDLVSYALAFRPGEYVGASLLDFFDWFDHNFDPSDPEYAYLVKRSTLVSYNSRFPENGTGSWYGRGELAGYLGFRFLEEDGWHYG